MAAIPERQRRFELTQSKAEAATAFAILFGSVYLFHLTFYFPHVTQAGYAGGALFPQIALGLLIFCSGKLLVERISRRESRFSADQATTIEFDIAGFAPVILVAVAYALLLERIGFELCTFVLMMILLSHRMRPIYVVFASAVSALVVYAVFALLLQVDLPLLFLPSQWPF